MVISQQHAGDRGRAVGGGREGMRKVPVAGQVGLGEGEVPWQDVKGRREGEGTSRREDVQGKSLVRAGDIASS